MSLGINGIQNSLLNMKWGHFYTTRIVSQRVKNKLPCSLRFLYENRKHSYFPFLLFYVKNTKISKRHYKRGFFFYDKQVWTQNKVTRRGCTPLDSFLFTLHKHIWGRYPFYKHNSKEIQQKGETKKSDIFVCTSVRMCNSKYTLLKVLNIKCNKKYFTLKINSSVLFVKQTKKYIYK